MSNYSDNNKRVAKNTLMLYVRMVLVLIVALYTSRVVLKTLGVSDFGVYNVVGGFVSMLAYLNSVFVSSTQRFMSFALGKQNDDSVKSTFATAKLIHLVIAAIILVVGESFGLWFVNNQLVIDPDRLIAANWVFQCSLLSLLISIITIPYNSCIVAHEHMHVYARVSILEVVLKLIILYFLVIIPGDKLILYALLQLSISVIVLQCYRIYSRKHFIESHEKPLLNKNIFKEMFSYAGWTTVGSLGFSFKDQFSNMILNNFFGTTINAARGISMVVNSAITSFATNLVMAISPQIVKQYASGDIEQSQKLVYAGSKYAFFLLSIITIPVIINLDYILDIWLDTVPKYTSEFLVITLISSLIYSFTNSITTAIQATGDIKSFQIGVSIIHLVELPIAYLILRHGFSAPYALLPTLFTTVLALVFRFEILRRKIPSYSLKKYYFGIILICILLFGVSFLISYMISRATPVTFGGFVLNVLSSVLISVTLIWFLGINRFERKTVISFIKSKINTNF